VTSIYKSSAGRDAVYLLYRQALAHWPVPRTETTVATREGDTFVVASGDASAPPLASDAHAAWLDDVWTGLRLTRASIVGISLGGWLAIDYAVRRPGRVRSLSLISPSGIGRQNSALLMKAAILLQLGEWGRRRALRLARYVYS
jgi:pimeloyl-ACP methyl ester carboxylesterase